MNNITLHYRAVVDWVELEVQTATPTQSWRLAGGNVAYVTACHPETGIPFPDWEKNTPTTRFRCRIQDPRNGRHVVETVERLGQNLPRNIVLISSKITAIEVAFDTYAPGANSRQLAEIVADRYRFSTHVPADTWHLYRGKGEHPSSRYGFDRYSRLIDEEWDRRELLRHLADEWQLADTPDKGATVRYHGYIKMHDQGNKPLPPSKWRARFEITLRGRALTVQLLDDLEQFDFTKLAEYFKFRRLADHLHPAAKYTLAHWSTVQLGRRGRYRRRDKDKVGRYGGHPSVFRASTVADERLNATAYECLRKLTREWAGRGASADFPGEPAPETRVDAECTPSVLTMYLSTTPSNIINNALTLNTDSQNKHNNEAHSADCISDSINVLDVLRTSPLPDTSLAQDAHRAEIETLMTLGEDDDGD